MVTIDDAAAAFLAVPRIAVTGVSRMPGGHGGNAVYKRLRQRGYQVSPSTRTPPRSKGTAVTDRSGTSPAGSMAW